MRYGALRGRCPAPPLGAAAGRPSLRVAALATRLTRRTADSRGESVWADMTPRYEFAVFAQELIDEYLPAGWVFAFDGARERGGCCYGRQRVITMSKWLISLWTDEQNLQVLLHEIGHAIAYTRRVYARGARPHGPEWMAIARSIGYTGQRCHSNPTLGPAHRVVGDR